MKIVYNVETNELGLLVQVNNMLLVQLEEGSSIYKPYLDYKWSIVGAI